MTKLLKNCRRLARRVAWALAHASAATGCGAPEATPAVLAASGTPQSSAPLTAPAQPELGRGTTYSEEEIFAQCVRFALPRDAPMSLASQRFYESRISNQTELHAQTTVSATVAAKGVWGAANASGNYFSDVDASSDSFYWLVDVAYETAEEKLNLATGETLFLTDSAKKTLELGGYPAFAKRCGTHFYFSRRMGAKLSVLYEFQKKFLRTREEMGASAAFEGIGVAASASFQKLVETAKKEEVLLVHTVRIGGDATIPAKPDPGDLERILADLSRQVLDEGKGQPLAWGIAPYEIFEEVRAAQANADDRLAFKDFRDAALAALFTCHQRNVSAEQATRALLDRATAADSDIGFTAAHLAELQERLHALQSRGDALTPLAHACLYDQDTPCRANLPDWCSESLALPKPDYDLRGLAGWTLVPLPALAPDPTLNFLGTSPKGTQVVFDCKSQLLAVEGLVRVQANEGPPRALVIGTLQQVVDPLTHRRAIDLCLGQNSKKCTLRIFAGGGDLADLEDVPPNAHIHLQAFDSGGSPEFSIDCLSYPVEER